MLAKWDDAGRICTSCDEYKGWDSFSSKNPSRDKHRTQVHTRKQPVCKECAIESVNRWRDSKSKDQLKEMYLQRTYGMSLSGFYDMLGKQGGKCRLCKRVLDTSHGCGNIKPDTACVDHCHTKGHVRGILCNECNRGLGYFKDNTMTLINAIAYLAEEDLTSEGGQ